MPIVLKPSHLVELCETLARANSRGEKVTAVDLSALNRVQEHIPEDMTVTVEAGIKLSELQAQLRQHSQWLPIDPPHPDQTTVQEILATNASGPRRFGLGTVRDYLIGLRVVLADGTLIKSGGKVVKNVAGYDLAKLFVGSQGTLGVIVEASFKLRPLPESEAFVERVFSSLDHAAYFVDSVLESKLNPAVLDLHNLNQVDPSSAFTAVLGFAGVCEDVEQELSRASEMKAITLTSLKYDQEFWSGEPQKNAHKRSVLPSRLCEAIAELGDLPMIARAGNGIIYSKGGPTPPEADVPRRLFQRVKETFDPRHIFPDLPA